MQWKNKTNEILISIIIIVGFVLRFYHFNELSFTWDELSAWNRIHFNSFSELIELGIKPDGHPAGVQVFLYYWIMLFGDAEWIIKLPFALMGVSSIYIFYKIGEIWWSKNVGLISAAFMASLQFFVLYSTIARPYISGLFLSLMMVYFWSKYVYRDSTKKNLLGFIIFAALSAYNHHFSLLFAAIVGLTGVFIIPRNRFKEYIISGLLIFILYIPHLPIFFHQLGVGGIGGTGNWLTKPDPDFFWQFILWVFHFSIWVIASIVFFIILSFIKRNTQIERKQKWTKRIILLSWFALPIIIGYFYSTLVNPVIQYSMLIFSFPYLLLLLFSELGKLKPIITYISVIAILIINISTLVFTRQHFQIISKQPFDNTALCIKSQENTQPEDIYLIYNTIISYQDYYLKKYQIEGISSFSIYDQDLTLSQFDSLLLSIKQNHVLLSGLPESFVALANYHFPNLLQRTNGYTYESYLLSRNNKNTEALHKLAESNNFIQEKVHWKVSENRLISDSLGQKYFQFSDTQEWGFNYSDSLQSLLSNYGDIIDMEADLIINEHPINTNWVVTFSSPDKEEVWRAQTTNQNLIKTSFGYRLYFSLDTRLLIDEEDFQNTIFKTYFWNQSKENFKIKGIRIYTREANPIKYGLFMPISSATK